MEKTEFYFEARITHIMTCDLIDIPKSIIKDNHQADMRDGIGLVMGLQEYYKKKLLAVHKVTCIGFEPIKLAPPTVKAVDSTKNGPVLIPGLNPSGGYSN